ncbi:MAG: hypothetical protein WCY19_07910 [Candidatus Gastranaerophilaceae bacterium]
MKVAFSFQKNNSPKPQRQSILFGAGLTSKMMEEIQRTDVLEISRELAKKGIPTDFKGNMVIAWCCNKIIDIFEQLNKQYKLRLSLPEGIYVEDFRLLREQDPDALGTCNMLLTKLKTYSDEKIQPRTIFFNSLHNWENIDQISDNDFATGLSSTPHFLNFSLHEAIHSVHEDRLLDILGDKAVAMELDLYKNRGLGTIYRQKYGEQVSQICDSAKIDPFEAIACDIPRVIASVLDKETLMPTKNPFIGTPYEKLSLWRRINIPYYTDEQRPLTEILRNFWNGKFD